MDMPVVASNKNSKYDLIIEEINQIMNSTDTLNPQVISLFEVLSIFRELEESAKELKTTITQRINAKLGENYYCEIDNFDYEQNNVCVTIFSYLEKGSLKLYFVKNEEGILSISESENTLDKAFDNVFRLMYVEINEWYEFWYKLKDAKKQNAQAVKSANSSFFSNIFYDCIVIYHGKNHATSSCKLLLFSNDMCVKCKCEDVCELLKNKEEAFAKKLFVNISDCPEWMQKHLIIEREEQIKEQTIEPKRRKKCKLFEWIAYIFVEIFKCEYHCE